MRKASRGFMTIQRIMRAIVRISPMATIQVVFVVRVPPRLASPLSPATAPQLARPGPRDRMTNQ